MTDHPRCATCAHWASPADMAARDVGEAPTTFAEMDASADLGMGLCRATPHRTRQLGQGWVEPPLANPTAAVIDGEDYLARLMTKADHYCPMHSALARG